MGRASLSSADFPAGAADGRGQLVAGGREWSFQHVSIGNPQCAIHVAGLVELAALDLPAIGPAIEADIRFPNRTNVSWYTELEPAARPGSASARGSSSAGWGRRCPRAPARPARRSPMPSNAPVPSGREVDGRCSTAASSRSRWGRIFAST